MSLQFGILGILTYAPMTGYNLGKVFSKSVGNMWAASLSQIYRELGTLEKKGFVRSSIEQQEDKPDKKIYSITEEGVKSFNTWLAKFPETFVSPKRDEFMLRIFFGTKLGKNELIKQFQRFIEDRKKYNESTNNDVKMIKRIGTGMEQVEKELDLCMHFTLKRAFMSNEVLIKWAEECIHELQEWQE